MGNDFSWGYGSISRCCALVDLKQKKQDGYCEHCGDEV